MKTRIDYVFLGAALGVWVLGAMGVCGFLPDAVLIPAIKVSAWTAALVAFWACWRMTGD